MRMQKGICIELDGDRSVFMLTDGRFVTGRPQKGTAVGEEAFFESLSTTPTMKRRRAAMFTMPIIATVAIVLLIFSTFMMPEQEAYGYVQVESNPGIELALDDERHVISLRELNEDGRQLIEQLDEWENGTLEGVLKNVLALSINEDTDQVTITTVQEQGDTKTISTVEKITLAALTNNADRTLHIHLKEANKEQWRQAKEQQVPVGQFAKNNRTFTSPANVNNEVQPTRSEDKEPEKTNGESQSGQPVEAEHENRDVKSPDAQSDDTSPANPSTDEGNSQPLPAEKPKTISPKENSGNQLESKPKEPAVKKEEVKPAKPSPEQPQKPNPGKDNNSAPAKPKAAPGKKEHPADKKANENKKAPQQNKEDKQKDKPQDQQGNKGNKDPKEKNIREENKTKKPQNNAPPKNGQSGNGKGEHNKNNSSSSSTDGKANAPHSENKAGKDDPQ